MSGPNTLPNPGARTESLQALAGILFPQGTSDAPPAIKRPDGFTGDHGESLGTYMPFSSAAGYAIVKRGVPSRSLLPFGEYLGLGQGAVADCLGFDRATARRKVTQGKPLPIHAVESMLKLLELAHLAQDTFESPEVAFAWLRRGHPMQDDEAPLDWSRSAYGSERVKEILLALKFGGTV